MYRDVSMDALADKVHNKKCHAHSDMHSITWPQYSTTIPTSWARFLFRNLFIEIL